MKFFPNDKAADEAAEDDRQFFEKNPDRLLWLRPIVPGELGKRMPLSPWAMPPGGAVYVVVLKVDDAIRLRAPIIGPAYSDPSEWSEKTIRKTLAQSHLRKQLNVGWLLKRYRALRRETAVA